MDDQGSVQEVQPARQHPLRQGGQLCQELKFTHCWNNQCSLCHAWPIMVTPDRSVCTSILMNTCTCEGLCQHLYCCNIKPRANPWAAMKMMYDFYDEICHKQ